MGLIWDDTGDRLYETGVRKGVLYEYDATTKKYTNGVAWNGLTGASEAPSGAEETALYANDQKYVSLYSAEEFGVTLEAYTYPDEFAECDGSAEIAPGVMIGQQDRKMFGLCYRTVLGNDAKNDSYGYKLHLVYGCHAGVASRDYKTINNSPEVITFSWEVKTNPVAVGKIGDVEYKPTSIITIDSTKFDTTEAKAKLKKLEDALYGEGTETIAKLPLPAEVLDLIK